MAKATSASSQALAARIVELMRGHSTAVTLLHQAAAARLGLGPTDLQCLDLLREHGPVTGSELAALAALTTGAITGVVSRLERAQLVVREAHRHDKRKQILRPAAERMHGLHAVFGPLRHDVTAVLTQFNAEQLKAIANFLEASTAAMYRHLAHLRAGAWHSDVHAPVGHQR